MTEPDFDPVEWWDGLGMDRDWIDGKDDKIMMTHTSLWIHSNLRPIRDENGVIRRCFPVVRRERRERGWIVQTGRLHEGRGPVVYSYSGDNREPIEYDSFDDLIADGWRVD